MTDLQLTLFGRISATVNKGLTIKFKTQRTQALLIYLAVEATTGDMGHRREALMELLWPGMPPKSARRSLRQTLYYLRKSIAAVPASNAEDDLPFIVSDRWKVQLNPDFPMQVDVVEFLQLIHGSEQERRKAVDLYHGDFLTDFYLIDSNPFEEWAADRRAAYRSMILEALDDLTERLLNRGELGDAERLAQRHLQIDNLRENAYRHLMKSYAWSGRQAEALALYQECVQLFKQELDSQPDEKTIALYQAILDNRLPDPGLAKEVSKSSPASLPVIAPSPYRGLFAFREEDASNFFGRKAFTDQLVGVVDRQQLLAIIGPSGSGKSSVLHAGLQARLRQSGHWLIASFRPGNRPFHSLAAALLPLLEPDGSTTEMLVETNRLAEALLHGKITLTDVVERIQQTGQPSKRLLLVADQFEEFYTRSEASQDHIQFVDMILDLVSRGNPEVKPHFCFAVAMRADFLDLALRYQPFADALQDSTIILAPMTKQELAQAIVKPAENLGVSYESGLVDRILNDVGANPGNLPLLEFALDSLWEQQNQGLLTHEAYELTGRVDHALAHYADNIFDALEVDDQERARKIFVQLVRPGHQARDTRRIARRTELGSGDWQLAQHLADARLVVIDRDASGNETVELVHETLIRSWDRLQGWLELDRTFRVWQERLRIALRQWQMSDREDGALLRGSLLAEAEGWLEDRRSHLGPAEVRFVEASRALRDRSERLRRWVSIGLVAGLLLALSLAAAAVWQWRDARQARLVAERQRDQTRLTYAQLLASQAELTLDRQLDLSLLLALEAVNIVESPETKGALLAAVSHNPILDYFLFGHQDQVRSVAISPDGRLLASGGFDGSIRLWDLSTGEAIGPPLSAHSDNVSSLAFSPDGRYLASGRFDDSIIIWDLDSQLPAMPPLNGHVGDIWSLSYSPAGETLIAGSSDGNIVFWDARMGQTIGEPLAAHSATIADIAISSNGRLLASAGRDNTVRVWDMTEIEKTRQLGPDLQGHSGLDRAVAFSSDSHILAIDADDNTIQLWDISDANRAAEFGELRDAVNYKQVGFPLQGHEGWITSLTFRPGGTYLASADRNGSIFLWDVSKVNASAGNTDNLDFRILIEGDSPIWDLTFSSDGARLAGADGSGRVSMWDMTEQYALASQFHGPGSRITSLALSSDADTLAVGDGNGQLTIYAINPEAGGIGRGQTQLETAHAGSVRSVAFSPDDQLVATAGQDGAVRLWQAETLIPIEPSPSDHKRDALAVQFSPDGRFLASIGDDSLIHLWDMEAESLIADLFTDYEVTDSAASVSDTGVPVNSVLAFSSGGDRLAARGKVGFLLWKLDQITGEEWTSGVPIPDSNADQEYLQVFEQGATFALAFSPSGSILASGDIHTGIRLHDPKTGRQIGEPLALSNGRIFGLTFHKEDSLVSIGNDGRLLFWDTVSGSPGFGEIFARLEGPQVGDLPEIAFSRDGRMLAVGRPDGSIMLWNLDIDSWRDLACRRAGRNLTQAEWYNFFGEAPYRQTCSDFPPG